MKDAELIAYCGKVLGFFGGDQSKSMLWWSSPNPGFGGVSPKKMLCLGKEDKVFKFIDEALSQS